MVNGRWAVVISHEQLGFGFADDTGILMLPSEFLGIDYIWMNHLGD